MTLRFYKCPTGSISAVMVLKETHESTWLEIRDLTVSERYWIANEQLYICIVIVFSQLEIMKLLALHHLQSIPWPICSLF